VELSAYNIFAGLSSTQITEFGNTIIGKTKFCSPNNCYRGSL